MAIYHTRVKTFSRAQGHASTAAAAYRAGLLIADERTGKKHDYRRRGGVVETRCVAPDEAPDWAFDPRQLWPAAEASERRKDATVAREFEIALPHELDDDQRSDLTAEIARALVERYRFAVQASIHEPQTADGLNYHAHILATTRRVSLEGLTDKTRELDGGPTGRGEVEWVREMVGQLINAHLAAANVAARVDHRSLKDQADAAMEQGDMEAALHLERRPTEHVGKNATALHRKGVDCERTDANEEIAEANEASWQAALAELGEQGRLLPTPVGHSQEQARKERPEGSTHRLPVELSPLHGAGEIRVVRGLGRGSPTATAGQFPSGADREQATREAFSEVAGLWAEGFVATVNATFKATTHLLVHQIDRLAAYVHSAIFGSDVRELLRLFKQLKRDAHRFQHRLKGDSRAQHLLVQAEMSLERFDSDHPTPGQLSRQEWSRRRGRRLRAVQRLRESARRAHDATGPEAQDRYNARAAASAEQLEAWSQGMLVRYPVEADREMAPAPAQPTAAIEDAPAKPVSRGPRQ
jgi:hypothetical protein